MLATNHALTGIIIGATLPLPVAIPVAFVSHFVLDMIPHFGIKKSKRNKSYKYKIIVFTDTIIALSLAVYAAYIGWWEIFWVGWVAYGPDAYWVYLYFKQNKSMNLKVTNKFAKFHESIQTERWWGLFIEIPFAVTLFFVFLGLSQ